MAFLDPANHPVWKAELHGGRADPAFAAAVADRLARIYPATAGDAALPARFGTDAIFPALHLHPFLLATARPHPAPPPPTQPASPGTARKRARSGQNETRHV